MRTMVEIARHELAVILRTRRAIVITALYMGLAVLGGAIYVLGVKAAEDKGIELFMSQGLDEEMARQNMTMTAQKGYDELAQWFAGVDELDDLAESLRKSVIMPVFFWCSLVLLPLVILLTSFDQLSADLQARSLTYSILRANRAVIVLGKALAHAVVFSLLTAAASAVLLLVASLLLETVEFFPSLKGLVRMWLLLIPFGLCYLGISAFCSASNTQPVPALLSAVAIIIALRVIGWFRHIPDESQFAVLQHARWLSPAAYHDGLWLAGFSGPLQSVAAYIGFAAVFLGLGIVQLQRRDL